MKFQLDQYSLPGGSGDRTIAAVALGGTVISQAQFQEGASQGVKKPDLDVCQFVMNEGLLRIADHHRQRLGKVLLFVARNPIDSADVSFPMLADYVATLRKLQAQVSMEAMLILSGTDTFPYLQACLWRGMPAHNRTAIVSTSAMRAFDEPKSDAIVSIRNAVELCLSDPMHVDAKNKPWPEGGRMAAVVNAGDHAFPAGFLEEKHNSTLRWSISRANRLTERSTLHEDRLNLADISKSNSNVDEEPQATFDESLYWRKNDDWVKWRNPRSCDFPQGKKQKPFALRSGLVVQHLMPGMEYSQLFAHTRTADLEKDMSIDRKGLNALMAIAMGEGNLRTNYQSCEIINSVAHTLGDKGIPFLVLSEAMDKQQRPQAERGIADLRPAVYPGDVDLISPALISLKGLAIPESVLLVGEALAEADRANKTNWERVEYVRKVVNEHRKRWREYVDPISNQYK